MIITEEDAARFWALVDKSRGKNGCWLWQGVRDGRKGYGRFTIPGHGQVSAYRLAYELTIGPVPDGQLLRHQCDVPQCVNPAHLLPGTQRDNVRDMWERGRGFNGTYTPRARPWIDEEPTEDE